MSIPRTFCIVAAALLPTWSGAAEKRGTSQPAALKTFLERQGFGGSPLQRRFGNHLFTTTIINGRRMALAIDTGCPFRLVDRASVRNLGLGVQETKAHVTGVTGLSERAGIANIATMRMGNCT